MKRSELAISASLVPLDYLMVILAGLAAYSIRYLQPIRDIRPIIFDLRLIEFWQVLWPIAFIWVITFALAGLYNMTGTRRAVDELGKIVLGCSTAVMTLMFIFFFSRSLFDSRFIIIAGWLFSIIFVIIGRSLVRWLQSHLYNYGIGVHRLVIIGDNALTQEANAIFKNNPKAGYRVEKSVPDFSKEIEAQLVKMIQQDKFDEILVVNPNLSTSQLNRLNDFSYVNHIALKFVADIFDFPLHNFQINTISGLPIVELNKTPLDGWGKIYKRIFDFIFSLVIIILLSPVLILTSLAVKLTSPGPVFFSYYRIGQYGKPFNYFKFRSMVKDAHKMRFDTEFVKQQTDLRQGSPLMKFQNDPRITPIGRFIRRYSIDELPELFNVLIGKMSLVGPRPHEIEEVERYKTEHKKVLTIKPGMTGMAQVSGRSDLDFEEEIKLDTWYMENWSLKLDLMILFKTPWAVLKKRKTE